MTRFEWWNCSRSRPRKGRIIIEQAKGMVAERAHLSIDVAFERLRGYARSRNVRLTVLCQAVVEGLLDLDDVAAAPGPSRRAP